jgi:hypothetical protein
LSTGISYEYHSDISFSDGERRTIKAQEES